MARELYSSKMLQRICVPSTHVGTFKLVPYLPASHLGHYRPASETYESPVRPFFLLTSVYVRNNKWPYKAHAKSLVGPFLISHFLLLTTMYVCMYVCIYVCMFVQMRVK